TAPRASRAACAVPAPWPPAPRILARACLVPFPLRPFPLRQFRPRPQDALAASRSPVRPRAGQTVKDGGPRGEGREETGGKEGGGHDGSPRLVYCPRQAAPAASAGPIDYLGTAHQPPEFRRHAVQLLEQVV